MKWFVVMSAMLGVAAGPAASQTMQAPTMGAMSATDVGIEPMMRVAGPLYARLALANEMRTIELASRTAAGAPSGSARATAVMMMREHARALRELSAIPTAASQVRSARDAAIREIARVRGVAEPRIGEVQLAWQRHAWALHSGYAADGRDPALRRFASAAVMRAESDLRRLPMRRMPY